MLLIAYFFYLLLKNYPLSAYFVSHLEHWYLNSGCLWFYTRQVLHHPRFPHIVLAATVILSTGFCATLKFESVLVTDICKTFCGCSRLYACIKFVDYTVQLWQTLELEAWMLLVD